MSNAGTKQRQEFCERMRSVALGATLRRRSIKWTVVKQKRAETGVLITLKRGRREVCVQVPVCLSGPILWEAGLHSVALPPNQRGLAFANSTGGSA